MARRRLPAAVVALTLLFLPACGGKSDADRAKDTMTTFLAALAKGDGKTACGLATASGRARLVRAAKGRLSCEGLIALIATRLPPDVKTGLENAQVKKITVNGNAATVQETDITSSKGNLSAFLRSGTPTKLVKEGGSWKVAG
jgi:hypothetical protein